MENEPSGRDPREIWQQQGPEKYKMSLEQLRLRAQQLALKMRLQFLAVSGLAVLIVAFDIWNFRSSPYSFQRAGFVLSAAWALYTLIQVGQNIWPSRLARDAGWLTCLAFSRGELQRQTQLLELHSIQPCGSYIVYPSGGSDAEPLRRPEQPGQAAEMRTSSNPADYLVCDVRDHAKA